jgi:hypothetical protein
MLEREVANLEAELHAATDIEPGSTSASPRSSEPAYAEFQIQRRAADSDLRLLGEQRTNLRTKLASYEERVESIPQVDRGYSLLVRDRENLMAAYQQVNAKLRSARIAEALEKDRKGERFSLIEPPQRPSTPIKPNRKKIMILGFLGSVGGGLGMAMLSELLHRAVHGTRSVIALLGVPPLAVIPYIENARDLRRRRLKVWGTALSLLIILGAAIAFIHVKIMSLDLVWATALARLENLW